VTKAKQSCWHKYR